MGSQRISNPWGEEGAQQLHLLRSNLIVDCRSRRSRSLLNVFTLNIAISVPPPPSLPNCPFSCHFVHLCAKMSIFLREVVSGFWVGAKKLGRAYSYDDSSFEALSRSSRHNYQESLCDQIGNDAYYALDPIFTQMPHIQPMGHNSQLPATIDYLDMNPQRLATKRLKPGFFRVQPRVEINGRVYTAIGSSRLLHIAQRTPVHVRHTMTEAARLGNPQPLNDYIASCYDAARQGSVMVSPFISSWEKDILRTLLQEKRPIIYLAENGFKDYYKPSALLFDAVANDRLLILSPWPYDPSRKHVSRADCIALNAMAEEICAQ